MQILLGEALVGHWTVKLLWCHWYELECSLLGTKGDCSQEVSHLGHSMHNCLRRCLKSCWPMSTTGCLVLEKTTGRAGTDGGGATHTAKADQASTQEPGNKSLSFCIVSPTPATGKAYCHASWQSKNVWRIRVNFSRAYIKGNLEIIDNKLITNVIFWYFDIIKRVIWMLKEISYSPKPHF